MNAKVTSGGSAPYAPWADGDEAFRAVARGATKECLLSEAVVDSGADESVAPPNAVLGKVESSAVSRAGGRYKATNGTRIPNLGQRKIEFATDEGLRRGLPGRRR